MGRGLIATLHRSLPVSIHVMYMKSSIKTFVFSDISRADAYHGLHKMVDFKMTVKLLATVCSSETNGWWRSK